MARMDPDFWLTRWRERRIGFHLPAVNPRLLEHADVLLPAAPGARILVPLCGKSIDMVWLHAQGYQVIGVELSELAVREFFEEQGLAFELTHEAGLQRFRAPGITLFCGDVFALTPTLLEEVQAFYDRAALVALPAELRARYVAHLAAVLPAHVVGLLVSFEYDQEQMSGPPFSLREPELRSLYEPAFSLQALGTHHEVENQARFREAGVTSLVERVYKLQR